MSLFPFLEVSKGLVCNLEIISITPRREQETSHQDIALSEPSRLPSLTKHKFVHKEWANL